MPARGDGKWIESAAAIAVNLPSDKQARRAAIRERCLAKGLNERMISRMISARSYLIKYIDEIDVRASHRAVESLMALERVDGDRAAAVRMATLRGEVSRAAIDQILRDATTAQGAVAGDVASLPLSKIIDLCCSELRDRIQFDWTQIPNAGVAFLLGADAEFSHPEPNVDENGQVLSIHTAYIWALTVSPHIRCATICGAGEREFLRSIAALSYRYDCVSVFCSSEHEVSEMKKRILQCLTPLASELKFGGKIVFHVIRE